MSLFFFSFFFSEEIVPRQRRCITLNSTFKMNHHVLFFLQVNKTDCIYVSADPLSNKQQMIISGKGEVR